MSPWPSRLLGPLARSQDSSRASTLRRSNQRPGDQQESSCDSCEWTPLYERRAFRNAQVQRCVDVARVFRCARGKLLGEKVPSESRIFLKNRTRSPCCARAASGHAAAPPSAASNARRPMVTVIRPLPREVREGNGTTTRACSLHVQGGQDALPVGSECR